MAKEVGKGQAFNGEGASGVERGRDKSRRTPDRLEQEVEQKKNLIGFKCPDRVCGRADSAKRGCFFPLAGEMGVHVRGKGGENKN